MSRLIKIYEEEEIKRIESVKLKNDKFEEKLMEKRAEWNNRVKHIYEKHEMSAAGVEKMITLQSEALSLRQELAEDKTHFTNMLIKKIVSIKKTSAEKAAYMAFPGNINYKLSSKQEGYFLDAYLAEDNRSKMILEVYIEFLQDTVKNLDSFQYSIKNTIDFLNYLHK